MSEVPQQQIEERLQQSLKELQDIKFALDETSILAITNPQGLITYANKKFCEISGYSVEELLGQDHRIINSGYHSKELIRNLWKTIARGQVWKGELRNRTKEGSIYWVDTTIVPFLDANKKPYQYVAVRHDISVRKRAEQRLSMEQAVARSFTERTSTITEASEKILKALSLPIEASFSELYLVNASENCLECEATWSDPDEAFEALQKDSRTQRFFYGQGLTGSVWQNQHAIIKSHVPDDPFFKRVADASPAKLRGLLIFPITYNGEVFGVINVFGKEMFHEDEGLLASLSAIGGQIGEFFMRKRMESELQIHQQKLKYFEEKLRQGEKLMLLGMLASEIAHEVGTPLNIISGRVEMLSAKKGATETVKKDLEIINHQIERITKIIRSRLDITRRRSGRTVEVNLKSLITSLVEFMRPQIEKNNILVQITLPEDLWVRADEDQLQQVFLNLLMNAIEAIEADGRIRIAAAERMRDRVSYWDIQVHDTGPGISHEELSLVFEPFYTSKKEFGGTGLGLSVVKEILKKHDGEISVETKLGEGSTFHVLLPK